MTNVDTDPVIRDALRVAANHVGSIPWEHNRDQAQAAVIMERCTVLRYFD
jgi:hypothetical protein